MSEAAKQDLLDLLEATHAALLDTVVSVDLEVTIHESSGWRGRDMLSHVGAWDREVAKALHEFSNGREYLTPDYDEDRFNDHAVEEQQDLTTAEVIEDWRRARKELIGVVRTISADRFAETFLYPWGDEQGTIHGLVEYFCDHDIEHKDEIEDFMRDHG